MADFQDLVWQATRQIPKSSVSTYKDIAHHLGCKAYRAVGNALHKNPHAPVVPCHRVVKSDGTLGGFAQGVAKKRELLQGEGILVAGGKIVDFEKKRFWFTTTD